MESLRDSTTFWRVKISGKISGQSILELGAIWGYVQIEAGLTRGEIAIIVKI
jgi:hypothetical protein